MRTRRGTESLARRLKVLEGRIVEQDDQPLLIISGYDELGVPIVLAVRAAGWALDHEEARAWGEEHPDQWAR